VSLGEPSRRVAAGVGTDRSGISGVRYKRVTGGRRSRGRDLVGR